ncbi:MAG: hypothetical protein AAGF49_03300 [Pseudomonadota bacterium]
MRRVIAPAITLATLLAAVAAPLPAAFAQSFQTALPLSPAERRAIETRLSTILELSEPNQVSRFELPTGRFVEVRPYRMVRRPGSQPCRGYRIDLYGGGSASAVDGFRCKRLDGNAWAIVEPEIVLPSGRPTDLASQRERLEEGRDGFARLEGSEPLYPSDDFGSPVERIYEEPRAIPPLPRPAPRGERLLAARDTGGGSADITSGDLGPVGSAPAAFDLDEAPPAATDERPLDAEPLGGATENPLGAVGSAPRDVTPRSPGAAPQEAPPATAAAPTEETEDPALAASEAVATPTSEDDAGASDEVVAIVPAAPDVREEVLASVGGAREVGLPAEQVTIGEPPAEAQPTADRSLVGNDKLIALLRDLDYLPAGGTPSEASVSAAIDEFALDERFALPVSADALTERLTSALQRSEGLPACASDALALCTEGS